VLLRLTPEEAEEVAARLWGVVEEYRPADVPAGEAPPDARRVSVQLMVFPRPGDPLEELGTERTDAGPAGAPGEVP
jgi:hypothetical protein